MKPTRERILDAACTLFYQQGIHATPVDIILEEAGTARQSLYLHFKSKDGLVLAFLQKRDERWRQWLAEYVDTHAAEPRSRLLALFGFLGDWFGQADFHGCAFINIAAEFSDPRHPFRLLAAEHKQLALEYICGLCKEAALSDPEGTARQLALLMEGAIATELVTPGSNAAAEAARMAAIVLDTQVGGIRHDHP